MSSVEVEYRSEPIQRALELIANKENDMRSAIAGLKSQIQDIGVMFADGNHPDKVECFRGLMKELLSMDHDVTTRAQALQSARSTYQAGPDITDFKALLEEQQASRSSYDPEEEEELKTFDRDTGRAQEGGDDDVVDMNGSGALLNDKCPLTMKSVMELEEAVTDKKGYIYEKKAIMQHLRQNSNRPVKCPVAGTTHFITAAELQPAHQVSRAKRRALFGRHTTQATQQPATSVIDADDI
mmetsp:Transcript_6794/g.15043  ORF Transcript_6794/g.15043 Transcript_6794/m.15043 type:complete len:240 (+) Transcript_6794:110-829(+)|eukprot:CAMPEP_0202912290 /NCGR_PEP_ID=MMETSP1392-20130828/57314_1 /ASSEMBLY_ACC=CAM_ASM_000868 /TAXON_ID=225041 /ORGANISM="Chlamydomonas chlamydogama, Strain SAG 11-48b" /LENGTH=239 /DNA_ID=CAMNT_0049603135 /DNA_START=92 /DNA_END=811 /DNA_ORIENTATION=-